jgi:hypothetical protein
MSDNTEVILIQDSNVKSVVYDRAAKTMKVAFGGGSEWKYYFVKPDLFDEILSEATGLSVLDKIRHNDLVGVRLK